VAASKDPDGIVWTVYREWWPFPGDLTDVTDLIELVIGAIFLVLWPFWLLTKFLGARWVVVIERDGHEVGREKVRGWGGSKRRVNELLVEVASGHRSGRFVV
jgi:hypothetical protein